MQLDPVTYHFRRGGLDVVVDISNKICTCQEFDIDRLLCVHAIAAAHHAHFNMYTLGSPYYTKEHYVLAYQETIYPIGS